MSSVASPAPRAVSFNIKRFLLVLVPLATAVVGYGLYRKYQYDTQAEQARLEILAQVFGASEPVVNRLSNHYVDANGDLLADAPAAAAQQIHPERLTFSYVAGADNERQGEVWAPLLQSLQEATGLPVEYLVYEETDDQLADIAKGKLHIAGLNTGAVPRAVNAAGFVPLVALGRADGSYGYTMNLIVPQDSQITDVEHLRHQMITFTRRDSNSGFKAPFVFLKHSFNMTPANDYDYGFSTSHEESIRRVALEQVPVAAVASDMIDRLAARGVIDSEKIRTIYTSERFPPAALGYCHNLDPAMALKVQQVLEGFQFDGSLAEEFKPSQVTQLVPVNYKNDWAVIRLIDEMMGYRHVLSDTAATKAAVAEEAL